MPWSSRWVPPELFVEYNGVLVYHVYKDDDVEQGPRHFWYTTDLYEGGDQAHDEFTFDVRERCDLDDCGNWPTLLDIQAAIMNAIDDGLITMPPE